MVTCFYCKSVNTFYYIRKSVTRKTVVEPKEGSDFELTHTSDKKIPLARCNKCKHCYRVLPWDILPRKTFSLSCIIYFSIQYISNQSATYRSVVKDKNNAPHYSTIHGWIGGIGKMFQDIAIEPIVRTCTTAMLLSVTNNLIQTVFIYLQTISIEIPERKYRTERRKEELKATCQLYGLSRAYFPSSNYTSLSQWYYWLVEKIGDVYTWMFVSRYQVRRFNTS